MGILKLESLHKSVHLVANLLSKIKDFVSLLWFLLQLNFEYAQPIHEVAPSLMKKMAFDLLYE